MRTNKDNRQPKVVVVLLGAAPVPPSVVLPGTLGTLSSWVESPGYQNADGDVALCSVQYYSLGHTLICDLQRSAQYVHGCCVWGWGFGDVAPPPVGPCICLLPEPGAQGLGGGDKPIFSEMIDAANLLTCIRKQMAHDVALAPASIAVRARRTVQRIRVNSTGLSKC